MQGGGWTAARVMAEMAAGGAESRKALAVALGLGKAAISRTVDGLVRGGYVEEGAKLSTAGRGRRTTSLHVRPGLAYLLGTDLEGLAVRACLVDCGRRVVTTARRRIGARWSVGRILRQWSGLLEEMTAKSGVRRELIAGIGAGLPGVVARDGLRSRAYLPPGELVNLDASEALGGVGVPVRGANNVVCVAEYERRLGVARGRTSFLAVLARYGIGAAMYGQGGFLVGDGACACELGHMRIRAGGERCVCGRRGCLDVIASGRTLPAGGRQRGGGEAELRRRVRALGTGIANLLKVFHPPLVVLDGIYNEDEARVRPELVQALAGELSGLGLATPEVVFGGKEEFKTSIGAALRAGDAFLAEFFMRHVFTGARGRRGGR